jgi:polyisoprenoid-binding protein YceI
MKKFSAKLVAYAMFVALTLIAYASATSYKVDVANSEINWTGRKFTGQHIGKLKFTNGSITLDGTKLTAASFEVDMNSMTADDLQGEYQQKLLGHLKSDDFFATDKHKTAKFEMKSAKVKKSGKQADMTVTNYTVTGTLTIKGISKPITFDVQVKDNGSKAEAYAFLRIDRTKYDVKYGSNPLESLGDKAIDNNFDLSLKIMLNK